jgi:hypothetical protein
MLTFARVALAILIAGAAQSVLATEPLYDQFKYGKDAGFIFPAECCWVKKPPSPKLREIATTEQCSAIGAPTSELKYEGGKLWLTGLHRCSGTIPLKEVYPEFGEVALAEWLSGTFQGKLNWLCLNKQNRAVFALELTLVVDKGVVTSATEKRNDKSACN